MRRYESIVECDAIGTVNTTAKQSKAKHQQYRSTCVCIAIFYPPLGLKSHLLCIHGNDRFDRSNLADELLNRQNKCFQMNLLLFLQISAAELTQRMCARISISNARAIQARKIKIAYMFNACNLKLTIIARGDDGTGSAMKSIIFFTLESVFFLLFFFSLKISTVSFKVFILFF